MTDVAKAEVSSASNLLNQHEPYGLTKALVDAIQADKDSALNPTAKVPLQALPTRPYLDQTVVPALIEGLKCLVRER
ncbi:Protein dpy-30 [Blyttiomyces sp. JEL0837]|nr:Protein dpy-30 [Blyttiomyces sp. JEL0837]